MSRKPRKTPEQGSIDAWAALLHTSKRFVQTVEAALKTAGLPPMAWYDVLYLSGLSGERGVRPFELQEGMLLEQYNISRLLSRMEQEKLIERFECPEDGRGQVVRVTRAGKVMHRKMWLVYGRCIEELVGEKLTGKEAASLRALLGKLG